MTHTSGAPSSAACSRAICRASEKSSQRTAFRGSNEPSRVSTMLVRPGSGRRGRLSQGLRPMITGLPRVSALKWARSVASRQGRAPSRPMTPFLARARGPRVSWTVMRRALPWLKREGRGPIMSKTLQVVILGVVVALVVGLGFGFVMGLDGQDHTASATMGGLGAGVVAAYLFGNLAGNRRIANASGDEKSAALSRTPPPGKALLFLYREGFVAKLAG